MAVVWIFEDIDATTDVLPIFLLQVFITLSLTRLLGNALSYIHQPRVIGEMIGGILLGPSLFGQIPGFTNTIFPTFSTNPFVIVGDIGLILFMFMCGVDLDPALLKKLWKTSVPIGMAAILIPLGTGCLLSLWLWQYNSTGAGWTDPSWTAFILFCGVSFSCTAFPVMASILVATKLLNTPIGIQSIACAAVDDVFAWSILAIASAFAAGSNGINGFYVFLCACLFLLVMMVVFTPVTQKIHDYYKTKEHKGETPDMFILYVFLLLIVCSFTTEVIGIHAFFGSFVCGIIMPKEEGSMLKTLMPKLELPVTNLLLPLYFANSGIRTDVTQLNTATLGGVTVAIIVLAVLVKVIPTLLSTRLVTKREWRFCAGVALLMNTRGLVELIALNVALNDKVFSVRLFTMFVVMCIATTFMTTPGLWFTYQRKYEEDEQKHKSRQLQQIRRHASLEDIHNAPAEVPVSSDSKSEEERKTPVPLEPIKSALNITEREGDDGKQEGGGNGNAANATNSNIGLTAITGTVLQLPPTIGEDSISVHMHLPPAGEEPSTRSAANSIHEKMIGDNNV